MVKSSKSKCLELDPGGTSTSCVKIGYNKVTGNYIVSKKIHDLVGNEGVPSSVIREVSFLKELQHINILRLLDVVKIKTAVYLIFENMEQNLKKFMLSSPVDAKNPQVIRSLLHQLVHGLAYCHSQKILHGDLKPENLMLDRTKLLLKLADFGSARTFGVPLEKSTEGEKIETLWYVAPELLMGYQKYSMPVDIWSAGCIFAEMVNQNPLFPESNDIRQMQKIFSVMGKPNEQTWPGVTSLPQYLFIGPAYDPKDLAGEVPGLEPAGVDLLSKMLCLNPEERISAFDALKHPYFEKRRMLLSPLEMYC